ncbi:MAG: NADPH-dependent F420 reductase [Actinomycetota bacterium]
MNLPLSLRGTTTRRRTRSRGAASSPPSRTWRWCSIRPTAARGTPWVIRARDKKRGLADAAGGDRDRDRRRRREADMRVAILGAGNVGSAVARAARNTGNDVIVAAKTNEKLEGLADDLGIETTTANTDAVKNADVVVLAVPFDAAEEVTGEIADVVAGTIVIDVMNPLKDDLSGLATGERSSAEVVQERLPGAKVVKAFNTVFASNQADPTVDGTQLDGFVAGDDPDAKKHVSYLLEEIGFRPIDVGPLSRARFLEGMALLNIALNATNGWSWQSGWKLVGPTK